MDEICFIVSLFIVDFRQTKNIYFNKNKVFTTAQMIEEEAKDQSPMLDDKSRRVSKAPKFPEMKEPTKLDSNILLKMTTEFFERVKDTGK